MCGGMSPLSRRPTDSCRGSVALSSIARREMSGGGRMATSIAITRDHETKAEKNRRERKRPPVLVLRDRAQDDVRHHVEKKRVVVDRLRARHRQSDLATHSGGFTIEVVQHFDVVAHESDRTNDRRFEARGPFASQVVADIRFEPRITGPCRCGSDRPRAHSRMPACFRDEARRLAQLRLVSRRGRHRRRNAVCGAHQPGAHGRRCSGSFSRASRTCAAFAAMNRRMIEPASDERHLDIVAIASQLGTRGSNVLAILLATRIRMLRGGDEADRSTQTRGAQIVAAYPEGAGASCASRRTQEVDDPPLPGDPAGPPPADA